MSRKPSEQGRLGDTVAVLWLCLPASWRIGFSVASACESSPGEAGFRSRLGGGTPLRVGRDFDGGAGRQMPGIYALDLEFSRASISSVGSRTGARQDEARNRS